MNLQPYFSAAGRHPFIWPIPLASSTSTESTIALDSAYTYASAGDAYMFMFRAPSSGNLTDFWVKVSAFAGTWASTDGVINVEVRENLNGNSIPGTTLVDSFTITLDGSTTGWIKKSGLSIALTEGKTYCIVVADADGGATNYCTLIRSANGSALSSLCLSQGIIYATNGFATAGTAVSNGVMAALKYDGAVHGGGLFSSVATVTSNTVERGFRFKLPQNATLVGWGYFNDGPFYNTWTAKLYDDATAPGGTPLYSYAHPTNSGSGTSPIVNHIVFPAADHYNIVKDTWYRFVLDPSANSTVPRKAAIGGSPDSDVLAAGLPLAGNFYATTENSGAWTDETDKAYLFAPVFVLNEDATGGGSVEPFRTFIG